MRRHLKTHLEDNAEISCPFDGCSRKFNKKSSFTSHLSRNHRHLSVSLIKQSYKVCAGGEPCPEPNSADTVSGEEESAFHEFVDQSSTMKMIQVKFGIRGCVTILNMIWPCSI